MLPNFFIVGAPKAGTTSLYYYLQEHPEVYMSPIKEPNFFAYKEIVAQNLFYKEVGVGNFDEYIKLFKDVKDEKAVGEVSVSYLFYPKVPKKIKKLVPHAKIIMVLRNPVDRAYSHYLMDYRLGYVDLPFDEIVYKKVNHRWGELYYQQYIELGLYYRQVKRYLDIFGCEHVKIYLLEELKNNSKNVLEDICDFLGINKFTIATEKTYNMFLGPKNNIVKRLYASHSIRTLMSKLLSPQLKDIIVNIAFDKEKKPSLDKELKKYLASIYKPDIKKLENLIKRDLSKWYSILS